jgi:hypothetical protein
MFPDINLWPLAILAGIGLVATIGGTLWVIIWAVEHLRLVLV